MRNDISQIHTKLNILEEKQIVEHKVSIKDFTETQDTFLVQENVVTHSRIGQLEETIGEIRRNAGAR